jgi:hypothetical protein
MKIINLMQNLAQKTQQQQAATLTKATRINPRCAPCALGTQTQHQDGLSQWWLEDLPLTAQAPGPLGIAVH